MGPHSDIDLLVIKAGVNRLELTGQIYRHMHGVGEAVDIVVDPLRMSSAITSHALVIARQLSGRASSLCHLSDFHPAILANGLESSLRTTTLQNAPSEAYLEDLRCFEAHQAAEKAIKAY